MPAVKSLDLLPPCPEPGKYIIVKSREGYFWRKKKDPELAKLMNPAMWTNADMIKIVAPYVLRLRNLLNRQLEPLECGRIQTRLNLAFMKEMKSKGKVSYACLEKFEFQSRFKFSRLFRMTNYFSRMQEPGKYRITILNPALRSEYDLVTSFYYEAILVTGDPMGVVALTLDTVESPLIKNDATPKAPIILDLPLTGDEPWIALLKVHSLTGNSFAEHPKHYGIRVMGWG